MGDLGAFRKGDGWFGRVSEEESGAKVDCRVVVVACWKILCQGLLILGLLILILTRCGDVACVGSSDDLSRSCYLGSIDLDLWSVC